MRLQCKHLLLALTAFFYYGCSEKTDIIENNHVEKVKVFATDFLSGEEESTRSVLTPSSSGCSFAWSVNDVVGVYSSSKGLTNFYIDENSISTDGLSANFNGSGFTLQPNAAYYAFYPYDKSSLSKTSIPVSYQGQEMSANGDFNSLGTYDYMYAKGTSDENNHASFSFSHIGCVVEFKIKVPATAIYSEVRYELESPSSNNYLIKSGIVNLADDVPVISPDSYVTDSVLKLRLGVKGFEVKKDSLLTAYMMMSAQNLDGKNLVVRLVDNKQNWYKAVVTGKNMRSGYTYHYAINTTNEGFDGTGQGLPNDELFAEYVSTYTHPKKADYEWLTFDDGFLYAVGTMGLRKISYADETFPNLVSESNMGMSQLQKGRAIAICNNNMYVGIRQNTGGMKGTYNPEVSISFDTNLKSINANTTLTNNTTLNAFIKKLRLKSMNENDVDEILVYKALYEGGIYKNVVQLRKNGKYLGNLYREIYDTKDAALSALPSKYTNDEGDYVEFDWAVIVNAYNDFKNIKLTTMGEFDSFDLRGSASFDETGKGGPNRGGYSGRFKTTSTNDNAAVLSYDKNTNGGFVTLWMKLNYLPNSDVQIPLLSKQGNQKISLNVKPSGNGMSFQLLVGNQVFTSNKTFQIGDWYNVKVAITNSNVGLSIRNKECGEWENLISSVHSLSDLSCDALAIGIITHSNNTELLIDDYYYNPTDIDKVSYVNGALAIIDKNSLSVVNRFNYDLKVCGVGQIKDRLIVNFLDGFNVYKLENPLRPELIYTYRPEIFTEYQGVDLFEVNDRIYAISATYTNGFAIIDLTDENDIKIIKTIDFSGILVNGETIQDKCYTFDVIVDYPYAWATIASQNSYVSTELDHRGVVAINLTDLMNPTMSFTELPKSRLSVFYKNGDQTPTRITKCGNRIIVNNCEFGVDVFDIGVDGKLTYNTGIVMPNVCSSNAICATEDGRLFIGDNSINGSNRNLYLYRGLR